MLIFNVKSCMFFNFKCSDAKRFLIKNKIMREKAKIKNIYGLWVDPARHGLCNADWAVSRPHLKPSGPTRPRVGRYEPG
jgi:hypothetical protein